MKQVKDFFEQENTRAKFTDILGARAAGFIAAFLQVVEQRQALQIADLQSLYNAAIAAAAIDLPLNAGLNYAYISSDTDERTHVVMASYNVGWKGYVQLALRSEKYRTINVTDVREGELKERNRLTGAISFEWIQDEETRSNTKVIGYLSYFELLNGFTQTLYMSNKDLEKHGKKYSQTYKNDKGLWKDDFDSMALKTVTKLNLSKNAPLSVDMQKAITFDQAIVNDADAEDVTYPDNIEIPVDKESERVFLMIENASSQDDLKAIEPHLKSEHLDTFTVKKDSLKSK